MAAHFSILAWEIPWTEEPGGRWSLGSQKSRTDGATNNTSYLRVVLSECSKSVPSKVRRVIEMSDQDLVGSEGLYLY